jgi:hypothetical protein
MMYSPDAGDAAFAPNAKTDKKQTSKRRFIMASETIYAGREIAQVVAGITDAGYSASTSSRTRSSHACRFRINAKLSPRTSASGGKGREL